MTPARGRERASRNNGFKAGESRRGKDFHVPPPPEAEEKRRRTCDEKEKDLEKETFSFASPRFPWP